ncbi:MAG: histidine ammonia-lyase [Acidimicrobiia bacterium]|nr:histidine ammonia-lyase [Acidimicrobiia bacterium]
MNLELDGSPLPLETVAAVAAGDVSVSLASVAAANMERSRTVIRQALEAGTTVYGVTTGFGALASTRIEESDSAALQVGLLRSHATGVGEPVSDELVRSMLVLRARTLAQGHSGVRPLVVERILDLLNRDLLPVVPGRGSVGASGDLAPFAHLMLPLIGEGDVRVDGDVIPAGDALAAAGIDPIVLEPKEGLSLLNGTEGMLAFGALGLSKLRTLAMVADIACAMSVEALMGSSRPFDSRIHELRPHPGQMASARNIAALLSGSEIEASHHDDFVHAVQDAYSLRCAPQVHGAVRDVIAYADAVFSREAGAVVDNPIVFPDTGEVVSGGNFHGQPLAFALDFLAIGATELASISERRIDRILDPDRSSGLPAFLARRPGLESGYMLTQYTAAALVGEARVLSHPASVESIPTSGSQEDHVSMGWGAGRKLHDVLDLAVRVIAIELMCAAEGVEHRAPLQPGAGVAAARDRLRQVVAPLREDRVLGGDIEATARLVESGDLEAAVAGVARPLI